MNVLVKKFQTGGNLFRFFTSNHTVNEIKIKKFKAFQNTYWWHALSKLDGISLSYTISLHSFRFT